MLGFVLESPKVLLVIFRYFHFYFSLAIESERAVAKCFFRAIISSSLVMEKGMFLTSYD